MKKKCIMCGKELIFENKKGVKRVTCSKECSRAYNFLGSKRKEIMEKRHNKNKELNKKFYGGN